MRQPKYTCANCESEKEPYFSRSEPMGFFCVDCGRNFDERDFAAELIAWENKWQCAVEMAAQAEADLWETKQQLTAERALADRLAESLEGIWPFIEEDIPHGCNSTAYMNAIELCRANITAWKEARSE